MSVMDLDVFAETDTPLDRQRDAIAELEAAHDAVLDAQQRFERRFHSSRRAVAGLIRARARQRSALERVGFATYGDFLLWQASRSN